MSSEALNPEPVTELPLTPPAEDDEEDAAMVLAIATTWKNKFEIVSYSSLYVLKNGQMWM